MNAGSLSLQKISTMKASVFKKVFFVLPLILFIDYAIMAIIGCTTCLFGSGEDFYCSTFCVVGKIVLALSALFFVYLIYPDITKLLKMKNNGTSTKKQENM